MSGADWNDEEGFDDLIDLLRAGPIEMDDAEPGHQVWSSIADELGFDAAPGSNPADSSGFDGPRLGAEPTVPDVISLDERRARWGRPAALVTLAAAVVLLLAVPVTLALRSSDDVEFVAAADLEVIEGQNGVPVRAEVVSIDGELVIEVEAPLEAEGDDFLELWLLEVDDNGVADLISLGRVEDSGRYEIPDSVDLDVFSVVDISVEPNDGNPAHSGESIVRGELA